MKLTELQTKILMYLSSYHLYSDADWVSEARLIRKLCPITLSKTQRALWKCTENRFLVAIRGLESAGYVHIKFCVSEIGGRLIKTYYALNPEKVILG